MIQVVDASAVASVLIDTGPDATWCEERLTEHDLAAPHLMPFEVANIIRRTVARGALDTSAGAVAMRDLRRLPVDLVGFEPLASRVWELRDNLTAYDASYVAVAEQLGCRLVTLDRRLGSAAGPRCPVVVPPSG